MQGKYSDGKTINAVAPAGGVTAGKMYRYGKWNGIAVTTAAAGATYALDIDPTAMFYIPIPAGVVAGLGDTLYIPPASTSGETDLTATAASNVAAVKVSEAKDGNNIVGVRVLNS